MRAIQRSTLSLAAALVSLWSCGRTHLGSVEGEVRAFAGEVARDVTRDGPAAWEKHFSDDPAFFMASNGELQFRDRAAATAGIRELPKMIRHITLEWSEVRVDAMGPDAALMGASFHEAIETAAGQSVDQKGYFTGVAERRNGRWQFRNAHWSVPVPGTP